jgi:hypothetical protein
VEPNLDDRIRTAVRRALLDNVAVPDGSIDVVVRDGWVTLTGSVALQAERAAAERIARSAGFVRGVTNELAVWPPDCTSELMRETIEETLGRTAEDPSDRRRDDP